MGDFAIDIDGVQEERRREEMKVWKKGLALVLAAAMCAGSIPGNVFAGNILDTAEALDMPTEDVDAASGSKVQAAKDEVQAQGDPDMSTKDEGTSQGDPDTSAKDEGTSQGDSDTSAKDETPVQGDPDMLAKDRVSSQEEPTADEASVREMPAAYETDTLDTAAALQQPQASDATGSPIEESFITLTEGQKLHQTTDEKSYYVFAPEESGWYHLVIESQKEGEYFTAGVYQTIYYSGEKQEKRTYRDSDYKVMNAANSDYAMWLNANEKYVFHCSISGYVDSSDLDVALTMKKAQIAGIETVTAPTRPSDFAFVGTGMEVKINYTDGDSVTNGVKCIISNYNGGGGTVSNTLESLSWSGIAVQREESVGSSLQVLALDEIREKTDVAELSEGTHTAILGVSRSVSGGQSSYLECTTSFEVSHNPIESISVVDCTDTYTQNMGESLGNITLKAVYKDGKTEQIYSGMTYIYQSLPKEEEPGETPDMPGMDYGLMDIDSYLAGGGSLGETTVTVRFQGLETSYQITILEYPYDGLSVKPRKTVYYVNAGYNDTQHGHSYAGERITKNDLHQIILSRKDGGSDSFYASDNQFHSLPYSWKFSYGIEVGGNSYTDIDEFIRAGGAPGQHTVTVSYRDFKTSYTVDIRQNPYIRMEIAQLPETLNYSYGSSNLYLDGLVIRAYKNDTEYDTYTYGQNAPEGAAIASWQQYFRCYPVTDSFYARPAGEHTVYLTFLNMRAEFQVYVEAPPVHPEYVDMKLLKKPDRTLYYVKENENLKDCLSLTGLQLTLTDSQGEKKNFKYGAYSEEGFSSWEELSSDVSVDWGRIDWSTPGDYVVSVYYKELCVEFEVTIADSPVDSFQFLRMPKTDTYYFYENKTISSPNLLYGLAYKVTFEDGSVQAATFRNNYGDNVFQVSYQGRTYTMGCAWMRSTSGGSASAGENAIQFTLFGETYQTDPITILENPIESLQVIKAPENMIYFGETSNADLYGAKLRITYRGGRTKEIEVSEHGSSVLVEEDQKYITAQVVRKWESGEAGGPGFRIEIEITYLNEKTALAADFNPEEFEAVALNNNGQAAGMLTEDQPYQIFSFTPEEEKPYSFFGVETSYDGSYYPSYSLCIELYDGAQNMFTGYTGGWNGPMNTMQSLIPGHTYYYIVSRKNSENRDSIPFECYLSSDILSDQQLGEPKVEIIDTKKKSWYEYELAGAVKMPDFNGTSLQLTYPNGWTEQKYIYGSSAFVSFGGKNYNVGWKYMDPQMGWLPEIRDDNALVYTCDGELVKEIPIQLNAPNPVESLSIDVNPFEGRYEYNLAAGNPDGLTVTVHFKEEGKADETLVWKDSIEPEVDGCKLTYDSVVYTGQTGEHGGKMYRLKVSCMDVYEEVLFEVLQNPVTAFELIRQPQNCTKYPFEGSGDLDLYGMEFAIISRDGTKQNIRVTEHTNYLAAPEGSSAELNVWYTSENREGENGEQIPVTALNLEYMGCKQKLVEFEHLPLPVEQAEELLDTRTNYMVLGEEKGYRIYRFTSAKSSEYILDLKGNINFHIVRFDESGEQQTAVARKTGQNHYAGSMQWDMAAGDTAYIVIKSREPFIGSLRAEISGEELEKEDISEVEFHVENPVAGEAFPATEQSSLDEYQIVNSQWYGDADQDGCADFATAHRLMLILAPKPRYQFTENTNVMLNGSKAENVMVGSDGRLTLYYTFPYTECKIDLPQAEGYTLQTDWNSRADRVSYGGTYRFRYLNAEDMPDETLSVKANGNVVALDEENYYTLANVTENISVTVRKDIGDIDVGEDESKITMHDRSEDVYDVMVGKKQQTIKENEEGNNTLPLLPSYTDGSDAFFYGWYLGRDEALNGIGTRFTSMTRLEESAYELFAKWGSGIFYQRVGNRNAIYQVLSFDEYNQMKVEMKGIRRSEIRAKAAIDAVGAAAGEKLEIPAVITQDQMQLQEGLELNIEGCTVIAIADHAFAKETGITSVVLPETVERIGESAFENCADLEEMILPQGVIQIDDRAFADCTSLKKVVLPDTVTEFGEEIFCGCKGISVVLPDTIEYVDPSVFEGAEDITIICSSKLKESGILEEIQKAGITVQTLDLAFDYENGIKTFSYGAKEERLRINVLINGEKDKEARPLLWQYTDTDAYTYRIEGNDLYVTPNRITNEEEEIQITATDAQTHAKTVLILRTTAADLAEKDEEGNAYFTVEVAQNPVYSGEELRPAVTVYRKGNRLSASDYDVSYADNINAGTGRVTVTGKGNYTGSISKSFTIEKAAQSVIAFDIEKTTDDLIFPINAKASGDGRLNYVSSDRTIASVDDHGIVMIRGIGTVEISIWASESANYQSSAPKTITLTVKQADVVGPKPSEPSQDPDQDKTDPNPPAVTNPDGAGSGTTGSAGIKTGKTSYTKSIDSKQFLLDATADMAIRYISSNPKVASVSAVGNVTLHKCGKTIITLMAGDERATIVIRVVPKKAKAKAVSKKSGELKVSWNRQKEAAGYVVEYSTDKKFKKNTGSKVIKKSKTTSITLKNLKKGKKYYVRVKAFTSIDKKRAYGAASKVIRKTVKK